MPIVNKSFSDLITFTRSTGGGRFNAQGQYEWLPANTPRIDYDPVTGECLGLLIEEQRTNLLRYSSDLTNAAWIKLGSSVVPSDTFGPDGTTKMCAIVEAESATWHGVQQLQPAATDSRMVSVFAKKGRRDWLYMRSGTESWGAVFFNLSTGEVGSRPSSGRPATASGIEDIGGGIYRCWATFPNTDTVPIRLFSSDVDGNIAGYAGEAGVEAIYIWGAQLETGSTPSSYIPTTDAQVTRAADIASVNELSPWYRADEGTLFVEADTRYQLTQFADAAVLDDGGTSNRVRLGVNINNNVPNTLVTGSYSDNVQVAVAFNIPYTPGLQKLAASYAEGNFASAANGALYALVPAGNVPAGLNTLRVGKHTSLGYINGHIRSIRYFPRRLSDESLVELTTP